MPARPLARIIYWKPSGAIVSTRAPTSSTSMSGGFARKSAARSSRRCGVKATGLTRTDRWPWPSRRLLWIDFAWVVFVLLNLAAILAFGNWETVPFHFIWVSLTILYGFRVWRMKPTLILLGGIIVATGVLLTIDVIRRAQPVDELAEVPLMAAMFYVMVWHAQRRLAAMRKMQEISEANLRLLERERRFIQNASHELRTPITVAMGHAELLQRGSDPGRMASDARIVVEELTR